MNHYQKTVKEIEKLIKVYGPSKLDSFLYCSLQTIYEFLIKNPEIFFVTDFHILVTKNFLMILTFRVLFCYYDSGNHLENYINNYKAYCFANELIDTKDILKEIRRSETKAKCMGIL